MAGPLEGLKILDFTYLLPGPFGTMMLADLGADIIKIENSGSPDIVRLMPPHIDGMSALYSHLNRGKRSLTLDLKKPEAREIVFRLVREYDTVIEQFRPGAMDRLGIGYGALGAIAPSLIFCSLTGYGQTGSYACRAGHDINYMALSGADSLSGRPDTGPVLSAIQVADIAGGSKNLVIGLLAAHIGRMNTGKGDRVDVSITDGVFAMTAFSTAGYLAGGAEPHRGDLLTGGALYDYYPAAGGGYLSVGPIEPKFFAEFCEIIGCPDIAAHGILNWEAKGRVAEIIAGKPLSHWREKFRDRDACVEPVRTVAETVSSPPISERDMVVPVTAFGGREERQIGNPIKFSSGRHYARLGGVPPGFHNEEILRGIGYGPDEIARFRESGAVGP